MLNQFVMIGGKHIDDIEVLYTIKSNLENPFFEIFVFIFYFIIS